MDLNFRAIHDIVHPTAAFSSGVDPGSTHDGADHDAHPEDPEAWDVSDLNPKNRVDSLEPLEAPLWRIDGAAGLGTQFFAIPLFIQDPAPMRLDVFINEAASHPPKVRELLDLDQAYHIKDTSRLEHLPFTKHILRILQHHTQDPAGKLTPEAVDELYKKGPFGTQIRIDNLPTDIRKSKIQIFRNYDLESTLLKPEKLGELWDMTIENFAPLLDIGDLVLVRQLQDSVSLVRLRTPEESDDELFVMKALTSHAKFLYHELRTHIFGLPRHPRIIGKPRHIITKMALWGRKTSVVGFTIPYHPAGTLRDILPVLRLNGRLTLDTRFRWAYQIADALHSMWLQTKTFYPDLRLDNIVLSETSDTIMIDFEQRGVWSNFASPEVDYFENLRLVWADSKDNEYRVPNTEGEMCFALLVSCCHGSTMASVRKELLDDIYNNPQEGYNIAWRCLTPSEREASMVYMLGRVLWCIFEGVSAPHRGAVWQSYRWEPDVEFPEFRATPPHVQKLILSCFGESGAVETAKFIRKDGKIYMKEPTSDTEGGGYTLVSEDLQAKAKRYWQERLKETEAWIYERKQALAADPAKEERYGRPTLRQVMWELESLMSQYDRSNKSGWGPQA